MARLQHRARRIARVLERQAANKWFRAWKAWVLARGGIIEEGMETLAVLMQKSGNDKVRPPTPTPPLSLIHSSSLYCG